MDKNQRCVLKFDEKLPAKFGYNPSEQIFCFQGALDRKDVSKQTFLDTLPETNPGREETDGAAFGLQACGEKPQLVQHLPVISCGYALFRRSPEHFLNTFEYWSHHVKTLPSS